MSVTRDEAKKVIKTEELKHYNWFNDHALREEEVGIKMVDSTWIVYATGERASVIPGSIKKYDNESDALDNFIKRLRTEKLLF